MIPVRVLNTWWEGDFLMAECEVPDELSPVVLSLVDISIWHDDVNEIEEIV